MPTPAGALMQCTGCGDQVIDEGARCPRCAASGSPSAALTLPEPSTPKGDAAIAFVPGAVFAGRYTIIEKAGAGGMGIVYKAIDRTLGGLVALKLVQPELSTDPRFLDRFKGEVRLTRRVAHPNICRVHDIGESDGVLYLSMEWIDGETLRRLLHQAGTLERDRALRIAEKIALALDAAHAQGIIHRDLKPENVMIDASGEAFVLDFGLAVSSTEASAHAAGGAGTPSYMAPEQIRRETIDVRADLYALGLILGEMLKGRRLDPDDPQQTERSEVGRQIGLLLARLTARNRDDRFQSSAEAAHAIRAVRQVLSGSAPGSDFVLQDPPRRARLVRMLVAGAVLASALGVLAFLWLGPTHERRPVGVSREAWIRYTSALQGLESDAATQQEFDDAIQMFHRAIEAEPNFGLAWAGLGRAYWSRYRLTHDDASKTEAQQAMREALRLAPDLPETHAALAFGHLNEANYAAAKAEFERALAAKSDMDWAWARLGSTCGELGEFADGLAALDKAIALRPDRAQYRLMLGIFHDHFSNYDKAAAAYREATRLDPGNRMAWNNLGGELLRLRQPEDAAKALERALAIADHASTRANLGMAYFIAKRYDAAAGEYRRAAALEPDKAIHWGNLGDVLSAQGHDGEALEAYRRGSSLALEAIDRIPLDPAPREQRALYCARAGDFACALKEGQRAYELQSDNSEIVFTNALIRCLARKDDEALDWLEHAVKLGQSRMQIESEAAFSRLKDNPRYLRILQLAR